MSTKENYLVEQYRVKSLFTNQISMSNTETVNLFAFFSANLAHFLPMLSYELHIKIFRKFQFQHWQNANDVAFFKESYPLRIYGWEKVLKEIQKKPGIICTYHFGAYQLINYLLVKAQVPFALLVAGIVKETWKQRYPDLLEALQEAEEAGRFVLLDANESASLRQMYKFSKRGFHLLVYVDGLEGIRTSVSTNLEQLSFMGQQVAVPWGVAHIAHSLQLPIYTMLALRKEKSISIQSMPTIQQRETVDRTIFVNAVMSKLYSWLATFLIHFPEQWTIWPHVHNIRLKHHQLSNSGWQKLDADAYKDEAKYGIYTDGFLEFLLRKSDMTSFQIDKSEFDLLRKQWYGD